MPTEQKIKTYQQNWKGLAHVQFAKDAGELAQEGWHVQSQTASGVATFNQGAKSITVVYVRDSIERK